MAVIGIDIGNVIIGGVGAEDTSFFTDDYLATPEIKNAFESITLLNSQHDVWLLSKCGEKVQARTLEWLKDRRFFDITGVDPEKVLFCRKRPQKAGIAKDHEFSVFIDDREDIIQSMEGTVQLPILFTSWQETLVQLKDARIIPWQ